MNMLPEWLKTAFFYEIYPQSFFDTNGDGVGDIPGMIAKLPYIASLGCNAIWVNPWYESPFLDAGYDVSDYKKIAPRYGTIDDAKRFFEEAHRAGFHVLIDLVPGHTSWEHLWFRESCRAAKNAYTDRYVWTDTIWDDGGMPTLRGVSERDGCVRVNFFSHQPALNYGYAQPDRPWQQSVGDDGPTATKEAIKDVMRFWLDLGADGFRVDMAASLVKNDPGSEATIRLWQEFRAFLDEEYPDCAMVSEWGMPFRAIRGGFHMDFLLHFAMPGYTSLFRGEHPFFSREGKGDITVFTKEYEDSYAQAWGKGLICIPSGNHDMRRLAFGRDEQELKVCFAFLYTMFGAPYLYYGDEIGMRYLEGIPSVEGGYDRTGSRSPMQWDGTALAGFSDCEKTYIPLDPDPARPNVASAEKDPSSLL
ncbi:MAG: alpha-amylase family glycosyl hydrolase, partial [Christensenellaceae bacterium]